MEVQHILRMVIAFLVGFASPSYSGDIISCDGFESCPSGLPSDISPAFLNVIVKDASGRVLGSGPPGLIINEKGYVLSISPPTGLLGEDGSVYYDTLDCSGPGFVSGHNYGGSAFSTTNMNGDFDIRFTKKTVGTVYLAQTYRIVNPGPSSSCIEGNTIGDFFPAFFNEPETTGVPNDLGLPENPYPVPLSYHRYGSE